MQRKILVVDDDGPTRSLLQALLEHTGYTCVQATGGDEALSLVRNDDYAVILLDLLLPDTDGFAILQQMKQWSSALVPRTIVLTAAAERIYQNRSELDGVWCVLKKPVDIGELGEQIEDCAEQRRRDRKPPARMESSGARSHKQTG